MSSKLLVSIRAAILLSLFIAPSMVHPVDLDDLYDNPDVGEALDTKDEVIDSLESAEADFMSSEESTEDELAEFTDSSENESTSISNLLAESDSSFLKKDVVVVLDNSGSMIKNDPDFLATQAVSEFISNLDTQTRLAIVIFDQNVRLAIPLTHLSIEARDSVLSNLKKVNYKGLFTDSPAAIERAIYELKNNGRKEAQKSIVFITDGIVDTGKPDVDLEKSKWLKEDLADDAADESIKVFGVAFTEDADFQLIQSLAQKTDGEYYRALKASDLQKVFKQINIIINTPPEVEVSEPIITEQAWQEPEPSPVVQEPVIIEVPVPTAASMSKEERVRSTIMIVAASILIITLLAIVFLMLRRSREAGTAVNEEVTEAFINDVNNYTGTSQFRLGQKPTMFGRVAGKDTEHLNFLVIPESTIGRRHALIEYKDYGFWICDQGSINGTFVNDKLISGEVCLKHGDKVRLHKCEFEFVMPELDDAGKTVISNTTYAGQADNGDAATVLKDAGLAIAAAQGLNPEFDITGSVDPEFDISGGEEPEFELEMGDDEDNEEETLIRGSSGMQEAADETDADEEEEETIIRGDSKASKSSDENDVELHEDSEDETLMPGGAGLQEDQSKEEVPEDEEAEDETLMRGSFDVDEEEDMTIRKDVDAAMDDFFDIGAGSNSEDT
ncbi:MAG: pSer/pThr/pTyr-binding forkhead associated (FHA) protein/Mg-chelatase subunit ChlD [Planctomycetota bacterium]|jgi:pSer/pThr/pTyr-binding forkhead associated (FHA) protein/Mg-chelatase subunit ChlD